MSEAPERLPWELAGGPAVGKDVPITGEPRAEKRPGVPAPPPRRGTPSAESARTEEREVQAADPDLSDRTNERLTEELREVVGAERVSVPADRPRASEGEKPRRQTAGGYLSMHRLQAVRATAVVLTFGGIIALVTGDWWLLPLAAALHALGTMTVTLTAVRMTTISERPSPQLAAALSEEGVSSPDERFSEMVEEFRPAPDRGISEVLSPGFNERTTPAGAEPAQAAAEQSSAMTPTAEPSEPAGRGGIPGLLVWAVMIGLLVFSIVLPATTGGWMWLLTAVIVPVFVAFAVIQHLFRRGQLRLGPRSLSAMVACTVVAVAGFCAVVAVAFAH
jgi:hypothetical protein